MILKEKKYQDFKKLLNKNVNSFHNYGINKYQLAKNFYPLALSQNYVEAAISLKISNLVSCGILNEKKFSIKKI